jgi:hypothetical protein
MSVAAAPTAPHAEPMHRKKDTGKDDPQSVIRKEFAHFCLLPLAIGRSQETRQPQAMLFPLQMGNPRATTVAQG